MSHLLTYILFDCMVMNFAQRKCFNWYTLTENKFIFSIKIETEIYELRFPQVYGFKLKMNIYNSQFVSITFNVSLYNKYCWRRNLK